jgi:tRNA A-37 threonylcarbamoyl transferase component Bud32
MQCPKCQTELDAGVRFCPHDGTPLIDTGATRLDSTPTGGHRPKSQELELPTVIGDRFSLQEKRGGGGMAKVYRARDTRMDRVVAVKLINPELRSDPEFDARFQREARISCQLTDPNIVTVHDFGLDTAHGPFLVMEFLEGQSLRERLVSDGPLPLKAALQVAGGLLMALVAAHEKGYIHRDIKPDNLFLLNKSNVKLQVKVLDFGIARIYSGDPKTQGESLTVRGSVLGTPRYMSPEQLAGKDVTFRTDIYSAALVIFESLTNQLPYAGGKRLCELCPDAPPALQEMLESCLKPDPGERPTALEAFLRLNEAGNASGILILPPGALERLVGRKIEKNATVIHKPQPTVVGNRRTVIAGAVAAVLCAAAVLTYVFWPKPGGKVEGPEKLAGIAIGDAAAAVHKQFSLPGAKHGDPWKGPGKAAFEKHPLLTRERLGLSDDALSQMMTRVDAQESLWVFFDKDDKVVAVLSTRGGDRSAWGVRVEGEPGKIEQLYEDEGLVLEQKQVGGRSVSIHRCDKRGVAFETQGGRVVAIALFPPR